MAMESANDRLHYFYHVRLRHPMLTNAIDSVRQIVVPGSPTNLILLVGPTGVGKTTLGHFVVKQIIADAAEEMKRDPQLMPAVMWESPLASEHFSFASWYTEGSQALGAPLASRTKETRSVDDYVYQISTSSPSVTALRDGMIGAAKNIRARVGVIDEGAHIINGAYGEKLIGRANALKSLSNSAGMKLVLLGSYDLYRLVDASGQLSRRMEVVHFPRYRAGKEHSVEAINKNGTTTRTDGTEVFQAFAKRLATYLPIEEPFNIVPYAEQLHDACLGIPGILKDTLHRALTKAVLENKGRLHERHLERALLTKKQRQVIYDETVKGEADVSDGLFDSGMFTRTDDRQRKAG